MRWTLGLPNWDYWAPHQYLQLPAPRGLRWSLHGLIPLRWKLQDDEPENGIISGYLMLTVIKWRVNEVNSRCDFRPLKPWKLASSHKNTALAKTLGSSPSRSSSCPLQICCHCGCWWCTWPKWTVLLSNQKSSDSVERGSLQLSTPSPAACTAATESTSQPVAIFHEISSRLPPRNSQRSQELMLLICTRRGINLCSNELGIPQRGRFRRAPWHICCYCRSIPFPHLK